MKTNDSKFWVGLGVGSIIGAVVYHFCCSHKGKQLKEKMYHAFQRAGGEAGELMDDAKDKAWDVSTKVADRVADGAFNVAEKADDVKNRVHSYADNAKK